MDIILLEDQTTAEGELSLLSILLENFCAGFLFLCYICTSFDCTKGPSPKSQSPQYHPSFCLPCQILTSAGAILCKILDVLCA